MLASSRLSRGPCLVALLTAATFPQLASHAAVQQTSPPATAPAPVRDLRAELDRLAAELQKLEPTAADYNARSKAILQRLIEVNQALLRENAALRDRVVAAPAPATLPSGAPPPKAGNTAPRPTVGAAPLAAAPLAAGAYFGSKERRTLHRAGCRSGDRIRPENRVVFANPAVATQAGYTPCKICRPELPFPPPK